MPHSSTERKVACYALAHVVRTSQVCYVVVCRGPNCRERGSRPLRAELARLLRDHPSVRLLGYSCFGQCERGPNVAFYPEGVWYGGLAGPDDARRVVRHATGDAPLTDAPLPPNEVSGHLRNVEDLVRTYERDQQRRWWWPF